jgi:hypothetical protein
MIITTAALVSICSINTSGQSSPGIKFSSNHTETPDSARCWQAGARTDAFTAAEQAGGRVRKLAE